MKHQLLTDIKILRLWLVIWILGALVIVYTLIGGIEAVVWCDVVQGFMLVAGGIICLTVLLFVPKGGPGRSSGMPGRAGRWAWDRTRST